MEIEIPKSLEALVRRKVEEGHYTTEAEVVADALRLMQVRDEVASVKRERLKDALDRGCEEGYSVEFFDMAGNTVAVATLHASAIRHPTAADRLAVRQLSA